MVDEVSSVSQQTAAEATNVSAASEEQTSSLSEATANIQQLSGLADDLHDNVADFDVGATGGASTGSDTLGQGPGTTSGPDVVEPGADLSAPEADGGTETGRDRTDSHQPEADQ